MAVKKRNKTLRISLLILLVIFLITVRLVENIGEDRSPDDRFIVTKVVDGDTVELKGGDILRLLSIDTPEKGEPLYDRATSFLKRLSLGKVAKIEYAQTRRDRYGRLLGYLYIDSIFVNKAIIDSGLGYLYLFKDNDAKRSETTLMLKSQQTAIDSKIGLWSLKKNAEEYYINLLGSYRLHRPDCRSIKKLVEGKYQKFAIREDGLKLGLSPCRNCRP